MLPEFPEAASIDHLGRDLVLRTALRIEDLRINLHAAGIDHRAEQRTVPVGNRKNTRFVIFAGNLRQRVERSHGDQRLLQSVTQSLGERHADAQSRIGAGTFADRHGVQLVGRNARFAQKFIDEHTDLAGMVAPLVALAQRKQLPVFRNTDRTDVRAGLDTKNKTHMILQFTSPTSVPAGACAARDVIHKSIFQSDSAEDGFMPFRNKRPADARQITPRCASAFAIPSSSTEAVT